MQKLSEDRTIFAYWADLIFLEAALLAFSLTRELAAPVTQLLDEFESILKIDLKSTRSYVQSGAVVAVTKMQLKDGVRELHNDTLHLVQQDRNDRRFTLLFPENITAMVRFALKRQLDVVGQILNQLTLKVVPETLRSAFIPRLQSLAAAGRTALDGRRNAERERTDAKIDIQSWKQRVNAARLTAYSELLKIAANTKRKRDWADTFFARPAHRDDSPEESEPAAPAAPAKPDVPGATPVGSDATPVIPPPAPEPAAKAA